MEKAQACGIRMMDGGTSPPKERVLRREKVSKIKSISMHLQNRLEDLRCRGRLQVCSTRAVTSAIQDF